MTNKNVIEIIDRLMDPSAVRVAYNPSEVFTAIVHGYYYIKPGYDTNKFAKKINKVLMRGWKSYNKTHTETIDGVPFEEVLIGKVVTEALCIARSLFDKEYYTSQLAYMVEHEKYDDQLLERYMRCLNEDELLQVLDGIFTFKINYGSFISDDSVEDMSEEFKGKCITAVQESPYYVTDYDKHITYINNNDGAFLEYLSKESIIDTICRYIDTDRMILANMIKAFKYSDPHTAAEYTGIALCIAARYETDIFNPVITDVEKINFDNYDSEHSKLISSNRGGKLYGYCESSSAN